MKMEMKFRMKDKNIKKLIKLPDRKEFKNMKRYKKVFKCVVKICLLLYLFSITGFCDNSSVKVSAATQNEAVNWAVSQLGKGLDYDGVYGNQCVDLIKYYYAYFGVAGYATGNANAYISNNLPPGWTRVYGNYQPGDVAVWKTNHSCSTCSTTGYGHVGIITSADNVGFNAVNQNFNGNSYCTQNWFNISALACAIRPAFLTDTVPPVISNVRVDIDDAGYSVYCEVTDNVGVDRVQFPTWPAYKSSEGCPWPVGGNAGSTWACRISYATFDNYKGLYHTHIYAYDTAGNYVCYAVNFANEVKSTPAPIPTPTPTMKPIVKPTIRPTVKPTIRPTLTSTKKPAASPTVKPTPQLSTGKNTVAQSKNDTYQKGISELGITTIKSYKANKHGQVIFKWYNISSANGYQIQYSRKKNFIKKKTKTVYSNNTVKLRLKANKKYYVRIRAFKYENIQYKVYGKWSSRRKIRTKN